MFIHCQLVALDEEIFQHHRAKIIICGNGKKSEIMSVENENGSSFDEDLQCACNWHLEILQI